MTGKHKGAHVQVAKNTYCTIMRAKVIELDGVCLPHI